jgi:hypothetical protein
MSLKKSQEICGVWSGNAFPTQQTTVVFCKEGNGLYFYYHGSDENSPYVDCFQWALIDTNEIEITWDECHLPDFDHDNENDETPVVSMKGHFEKSKFTVEEKTELLIELGQHNDVFADIPLIFQRPSKSFEEEKTVFKELSNSFSPFGAWTISKCH